MLTLQKHNYEEPAIVKLQKALMRKSMAFACFKTSLTGHFVFNTFFCRSNLERIGKSIITPNARGLFEHEQDRDSPNGMNDTAHYIDSLSCPWSPSVQLI
jgi:hypothetical protein